MAKRFKLNLGDVFTIPINDHEVGFGQIVIMPDKYTFIMAVFDFKQKYSEYYDSEMVCNNNLLFLGYSQDAKLYHNDWNIIGNHTSNLANIKMPYHHLGTPPGEIYLTNYKSERVFEIDEQTFHKLDYLTNYAPIRYENALKAYFGLGEWKTEHYDKLLYKHAINSNRIAQEVLQGNLN